MEKGEWQVWLVDANADRVGNPMTFPHSFAGAMAFCRGYMSRANDLATGLVPIPFPCVVKDKQELGVKFENVTKDWDGWRLAVVADLPCHCRVNGYRDTHPKVCISRHIKAMTSKFLYKDVDGQIWPYAYVPVLPGDK